MLTRLRPEFRSLPEAEVAEAVLRRCVHCGFCTATCPTYRLLGDENDGPRGRLYLMKAFLEGGPAGSDTVRHLDRCLTCRSCETTCPSGVEYHRVLERVRPQAAERLGRPWRERLARAAIGSLMPRPDRVTALLDLARHFDFLLPGRLRRRLPQVPRLPSWRDTSGHTTMLVLPGCVQQVTHPGTNRGLARLLARQGVGLRAIESPSCCGALNAHLDQGNAARRLMQRMIETWQRACREQQSEVPVLAAASGCGLHLREYDEHFAGSSGWAERAAAFAAAVRDPAEVLDPERVQGLAAHSPFPRIVFHAPCTLQHGLRLDVRVRELLTAAGFELLPVREPWRCCGSAGAWSLLHPELSERLLEARMAGFPLEAADAVVTANVGCQMHIATATALPVLHWIELLAEAADRRDASRNQSPETGSESR